MGHVHSEHDHHHHDGHTHQHPVENYSARKHPEFVVLDIGEELGALIIYADPAMHGREIEISPAGQDGNRSHKEVLERTEGDRAAFTAVFDALPTGTYTLWVDDQPRARNVIIDRGGIVHLDWRGAEATAPSAA